MSILKRAAKESSAAIVAVLAAAAASTPTPAAGPALQIEGGQIADVIPESSGIRVFKGIPYAAPPVGELRKQETPLRSLPP
jgi:hypothetical protein